jgi:hypothetical protein
MGMSLWGLFAAPLLATAAPSDQSGGVVAPFDPLADEIAAPIEQDAFSGFAAMDETAMADASGGANTAVNIGLLVSNSATQNGGVSDVSSNGDTGQIANNSAANNSGITTIFNNTGNGVVFQSTVNVNIFLGGSAPN